MALSERSSRHVEWAVGFLQALVATFRSAHVPFLAGSIAYAAFVSLLPLLVLAVLVASAVGGEAFVDVVLGLTEAYLSPTGQDLVAGTVEQATAQTGLSVLSVAVLLWATLRLFRSLDLAFSLIYGTEERADFASQLVDGVTVLVAMGLAAGGIAATLALVTLLPDLPRVYVVEKLVLVGFLTVALFPLYYVFPDRSLSLDEVLPGTIVAAAGWTLLEIGFEVYVGLSSASELYGVVGGVILLITWLYFGAVTVLLGATVNVVLFQGSPSGPEPVPA